MVSPVSADEIRPPVLSTSELVGLSVTGLLIAVLVVNAVFFDAGTAFLVWQIPNLVFAALAAGATFALLRRKRSITFKHACGVATVSIVVTSIVATVQFGLTLELLNMEQLAPYVLVHCATYILPVVMLFLLGAARTSRQRFTLSLLLVAVLVALVIRVSGPPTQFVQVTFYSVNLVLGFPLAVLSRLYSS